MDAKVNPTETEGADCHVCGHFGTRQCAFDEAPRCRSFLTWTDLWQREMQSIKRAQRTTYLLAGVVALLAIFVMVLPILLG